MKKLFQLTFFLFVAISTSSSYSQSMDGTWYLIQATRVDGSRILYKFGRPQYFMFVIKDKKMMPIDTPGHHLVTKLYLDLRLKDKTHAESDKFDLFLHSDSVLVVTENAPEEADKRSQFFFFNSKNYFKAIQGEIKYEDKETILANDLLFPYDVSDHINDGVHNFLSVSLVSPTGAKEGAISGYFTIASDLVVKDVQIVENRNFKYTEKLTNALTKTKGWVLPMANVNFKVPFTMSIENSNLWIKYRINDFEGVKEQPYSGLTEKAVAAKREFSKGTAAAKRGNYEKAIEFFTEAIKQDDYLTDAYYNRAYSYMQLNKKEMACQDWKALKDLGQVNGEKLYNENCK